MMKRILILLAVVFCFTLTSAAQSDTITKGYRQAEFPGGLDSLYTHLEQTFRISRTELEFQQYDDLVADVRLTINKRGQVVNVTSGITRLEYELQRAFMSLPPFMPAARDGTPVTSYVELKFMFFIKGNRMEVTDHLQYNTYTREKEQSWIKAALVAGAVVIFLILWGV